MHVGHSLSQLVEGHVGFLWRDCMASLHLGEEEHLIYIFFIIFINI